MALPLWIADILVFFTDGRFLRFALATVALFCIIFITWWIYRALSDRNLFNFLKKHGELPHPSIVDRILYTTRYAVLFPLYSFAGFLIIACSLFIVTRPVEAATQDQLLFVAIALVGTIRIAAYVSEHLAEDVAKLIPLSTIALVINNPAQMHLTEFLPIISSFAHRIPSFAIYLVFIAVLEIALRFSLWVVGRAGFDPKSEEDEQ